MLEAFPMLRPTTLIAWVLVSSVVHGARPLQVDDLFKVRRVADPQVAVTGAVAYQVTVADPGANTLTTRIWLKLPGQEPRELALGPGNASHPRFSPDGNRLAYQSGGQIWVVDLTTSETKRITDVPGGASGALWSPDGSHLAFVSSVRPSGDLSETAAYLKAQEARKATGRRFEGLMYRHWMAYRDPNLVSHLFVVKADGTGGPRDLTPHWRFDIPNAAGVDAGEGYAWSPDGTRLAFSSHPEFDKATSTNGEIYEVALEGGEPKRLSTNPAMDCSPCYSPDGRYLAWRAQRRPGFEADRWELWVMDRATGKVLYDTRAFDAHVDDFAWAGDAIVFSAEVKARKQLWRWVPGKAPRVLTKDLFVEGFALNAKGDRAVAHLTTSAMPADLFEIDLASGNAVRLTRHNEALAQELGLNRAEDLWVDGVPGPDGKPVKIHSLVVKPVGFDPTQRYPVAFIIHGGPQGSNADHWHYRWNYQSWAGRGFLVVAPNPRGSTGFGQAFTDAISGDWSGRVMKDLLACLDGALKAYPNADPKRVIAAGGSYGGYAVNWLAGHHADRFKAFVSHAGIFNTQSMQLATEELWFPKWEFKGFPWERPATQALWEKHSPHRAYAGFRKPMLVIHGELDYRVVYTEALQLFNVHQLRGIPSELLLFPDEGHFVAKPANSKLWYETVLAWFERWGR